MNESELIRLKIGVREWAFAQVYSKIDRVVDKVLRVEAIFEAADKITDWVLKPTEGIETAEITTQ